MLSYSSRTAGKAEAAEQVSSGLPLSAAGGAVCRHSTLTTSASATSSDCACSPYVSQGNQSCCICLDQAVQMVQLGAQLWCALVNTHPNLGGLLCGTCMAEGVLATVENLKASNRSSACICEQWPAPLQIAAEACNRLHNNTSATVQH